jgi:dethiobiotin synthetase
VPRSLTAKLSRCFVTGTDTGVGKTEVSSALLRLMVRGQLKPLAFKPYESGMDDLSVPSDSLALREAAGAQQSVDDVNVYRFRAPLAPMYAAKVERKRTSFARVVRHLSRYRQRAMLVEGAGGIAVPLDSEHDVIDLIAALQLPAVVVARAGLGTINHTTLTVQRLQSVGISVAAVVLVQSTPTKDPSMKHNSPELTRRFKKLPVVGPIPFIDDVKGRAKTMERFLFPLLF